MCGVAFSATETPASTLPSAVRQQWQTHNHLPATATATPVATANKSRERYPQPGKNGVAVHACMPMDSKHRECPCSCVPHSMEEKGEPLCRAIHHSGHIRCCCVVRNCLETHLQTGLTRSRRHSSSTEKRKDIRVKESGIHEGESKNCDCGSSCRTCRHGKRRFVCAPLILHTPVHVVCVSVDVCVSTLA